MADDDASRFFNLAEGTSPAEAMREGFSAWLLALWGGIIMITSAATDGITELLDVLSAAREFFVALLTNPTMILSAGAGETARSITTGEWAFFGPATFAVAVFAVAAGWAVWTSIDPEIPLVDGFVPWR